MSERNPNKKVANSLVAMSSAAVLAVYAAGYTRTQAAAEKLDTQSEERRPSGQGRGRGPAASSDAPSGDAAVIPNHEPAQVAERAPSVAQSAAVSPAPVVAAKIATPVAGAVEPTATVPAATLPAATLPATTSNAPVPEPAAAPVVVVEHKPEPVPVAAPPPPPPPPAPKWKDGTYTGWGTSRHGDIQAQVIIEDGRIKSATIAQCYTRYSCDVIDKIIPQVAQRQSPETDYVSGATQSTNAFYYGVVDALSKAK